MGIIEEICISNLSKDFRNLVYLFGLFSAFCFDQHCTYVYVNKFDCGYYYIYHRIFIDFFLFNVSSFSCGFGDLVVF